jgi:hypothetical protein
MILSAITQFAAGNDHCFHRFFGLVPWYEYLKERIGSHCEVKGFRILPSATNKATDVPLIAAAVVDDLLRIAGMVALAFVIVGAIRYIYSQGDPESTAQAQSTLVNALIGLAIALVGVAFLSFVANKVGG